MKSTLKSLLMAVGLLSALACQVQAQTLPAGAPAGTTVQCKDDSFASPEAKSGACRGHKGIKTWYGKAADAKPVAPVAAAPAVETQSAAVSATKVAPSTGSASKTFAKNDPSTMTAAPGGGAGQVWANDNTKVYHCMGDKYYGKTKKGEYMTEADAKAKGMHASKGSKACAA